MCPSRCGRWRPRCSRLLPSLFDADGGITIGPFPKGLPVNLLSNLQPLPESSDPIERLRHVERMVQLLVDLKLYLVTLPARRDGRADGQRRSAARWDVAAGAEQVPGLRGQPRPLLRHRPWSPGEPALSDDDKRALIEFLKTF